MDPTLQRAIARIDIIQHGKSVSRGTGFLVARDLVLTALHVVADRSASPVAVYPGRIAVTFPTHSTDATVVDGCSDPRADWILLRCQTSPAGVRAIPLADRVEDGAAWETYGFPDANPRDGMVQMGSVEHAGGTFDGVPAYQLFSRQAAAGTGAPVSGLSGSPVIVEGAVVGLLRSSLMNDGHNVAGTLYGCPIDRILERCGDLLPIPEPARGLSPFSHRFLATTQGFLFERPTTPFTYGLPARGLVVGRDSEIDVGFREWMKDRARPLLIWGPPGIGKSTLALALLHHSEVAQRFGARRFLIRCDGFTSVEAVQTGMGAQWFGLAASPRIGGEVLAKLNEGPAAIVVDNFETPYRAAGEECEDWLRRMIGVPNVWLIVGVQGHEAPGSIDWIRRLEPNRLTLAESRQLFCRIAGVEFEHNPVLDGLLKNLDGVPHAIELLARQAESDPDLSSLAERWGRQRTTLLQRGMGTTRQTNIAISYEFAITSPLMTEASLRMLRVVANLPGGLANEDVPMAMESFDGSTATDAAAALKRCALAFAESDRLRVLAPLREHVLRMHPADASDLHPIRDRFLRMAESGVHVGAATGGDVLRTLTKEHSNCRWAVQTALDEADHPSAVEAALGLGNFSRFSGIGGPEIVERARQLAHDMNDRSGEAWCVERLGDIAQARSNNDEAWRRYEQALSLYRGIGDRRCEAICIKRLGDMALRRSDHADARQRYEEALHIFRELGVRLGEATCIHGLGDIALQRNDRADAQHRYEAALPIYREIGSAHGRATCIFRLGELAAGHGDYAEARRRYEEALTIYQDAGVRVGEANCVLQLGSLALTRGDHALARLRHDEARLIYKEIEDCRGEATCISGLAHIALDRGDHASARQQYEEALSIFRDVRDRHSEACCIQRLGDTALKHTEYAEAQRRYGDAMPIYREIGDRRGEANCLYGLGEIAVTRTDLADAYRQYEAAQSIYRQIGERRGEAICIQGLAKLALACDDHAGARQYYKDALERFRSLHEPVSIGQSLLDLARLEHDPDMRSLLIREIVEWWKEIDRQDLLQDLAREFPGEVSSTG